MKQKIKVLLIVAAEFVCVVVILLMIFFAGKKSYTVTFDINGGTLISGDLVQRVVTGSSANPPTVTKDGSTFKGWTVSYKNITHDVETRAVWEYTTTAGIEYKVSDDTNYCTITGCYKGLVGDVYIDAYYQDHKVLEIEAGAFADCPYIERVFLLDGIIKIQDGAFKNCTSLTYIELPGTLFEIGKEAFMNCKKLEEVELPKVLKKLGEKAFFDCDELINVEMPKELESIGAEVFNSDHVTINFSYQTESMVDELYGQAWYQGNPVLKFAEEEASEDEKDNKKDRNK